ncbi:hypothetical protein [Agrobacterium tumefaciens]|uniref:hypothetical protein n=1 Tax=Agrobacterium tumefaciens TaxID=358 RepID=UPI00157335D4|nr:hypothetical protein [Agrobacterium tumefaciens]
MDLVDMLISGVDLPAGGRRVIGRVAYYAEGTYIGDHRQDGGRMTLPIRMPSYELTEGNMHRDAALAFKDYAAWCARMVPWSRVVAAPTINVADRAGAVQSFPSAIKFTAERVGGSGAAYRIANLLISSALTPSRRFSSRARRGADQSFDMADPSPSAVYGDEEMLRLIYQLIEHEADLLWPAEGGEMKWSDRISLDLSENEDESREDRQSSRADHRADAWVRFALAALDHPGIANLAFLDLPFHTMEFARIWSGDLGREINESRDPFWPR